MKPKTGKSASHFTLHLALLLFAFCPMPGALSQQYGWVDLTSNLPDTVLFGGLGKVVFKGDQGWITQAWYDLPRKVFFTPDGGQTFSTQYLPDDAGTIGDIYMRSASEGYIVTCWDDLGNSGKIFHTVDAQNDSWSLLAEIDGAGLFSISFPPFPATTGFIGSAAGEIWQITDGMVTYDGWCHTNYDIMDIAFPVNSEEGWAVGGLSLQHRTSEGWQMADQNFSTDGCSGVCMIDNLNGWVCGDDQYILHTTDGHNWIIQHSSYSKTLHSIDFCDLYNGWAVGNGSVFHTTDGGAQWMDESWQIDAEDIELTSVNVVDIHTAYAVGNRRSTLNPVFLKYSLIEGVDERGGVEAWRLGGVEVWPNPTRGVVSLRSSVSGRRPVLSPEQQDEGSAVVEILDLNGKTLEFWNLEPGTWNSGTLELDLTSYPAGVYFLRINTDNEMIVKKIIKY